MQTRQEFYCNPPVIKLSSSWHTWKDQYWPRCLLSHGDEGYLSLLWVLFSSNLSHLFLSDSVTLISSFLTSSGFCPQIIKSQILSLSHTDLAAISVHPWKCKFINFPKRKTDIKIWKVCPSEEKEISKQWEGKQDPWTNAKIVARVEKDKGGRKVKLKIQP